jgi:hypothetical protein
MTRTWFSVRDWPIFNVPEEALPGYPGMVIREADGERVLQSMAWGFPLRLKGLKPIRARWLTATKRYDERWCPGPHSLQDVSADWVLSSRLALRLRGMLLEPRLHPAEGLEGLAQLRLIDGVDIVILDSA